MERVDREVGGRGAMAGSTGGRILWGAIVVPPLLLLGGTGAIILWPERTVGVMDAVQRVWLGRGSEPVRHFLPLVRTPGPPPAVPAAIFRGIVRTSDGRPLRGGYTVAVVPEWRKGRLGRMGTSDEGYASFHRTDPSFEAPILAEPARIVILADGYAPKVMGPYPSEWPPPSETLLAKPAEVVLEPGVPFEARIVDDRGEPIPGAEARACLIVDGRSIKLPNPPRCDDEGRAFFPHLSEADYEFEPNVHQFLFPDDAIPVRVTPNGSETIPLERGPLPGLVVDEAGRPVKDALLLVASELDARLNMAATHLGDRVVLAKSDAEGRFSLPGLHSESVYLVRGEGPDGSLGFARSVRRGDGETSLTLHPRRVVQGVIERSAGGLPSAVKVQHSITTGFASPGHGGDPWGRISSVRMAMVDQAGRFEFPTWETVDAEVAVDGRVMAVPWPPDKEPLRIETAGDDSPERTVRLRFISGRASGPIRGTMTLHLIETPPERAHQDVTRTVEVGDGREAFRCLSNESFRYDSNAVPGFWTVPARIDGGGPAGDRAVDVRVFAAGSISGLVLEADGTPVGDEARLHAILDPNWIREELWRDDEPRSRNSAPTGERTTTDDEGRFVIPAFPLNVRGRLVVERGRYVTRGEIVRLSPDDPRPMVELRLPKRAGASVRVLDSQGRPIAGASLEVVLRREGDEQRSWPMGVTDADGLCAVDDLAEGEENYSVVVRFAEDHQPIVAPLIPGGPTLELRAMRGNVLEGRVVEAVTGWPIPDLSLHVLPDDPSAPQGIETEVRTDADGRFRLTTLFDGPIRLEDRRGLRWLAPRSPIIPAGTSEPIVIRLVDLRAADPAPRPIPEF